MSFLLGIVLTHTGMLQIRKLTKTSYFYAGAQKRKLTTEAVSFRSAGQDGVGNWAHAGASRANPRHALQAAADQLPEVVQFLEILSTQVGKALWESCSTKAVGGGFIYCGALLSMQS